MENKIDKIINSICIVGNYWESCRNYYELNGCDKCKHFIYIKNANNIREQENNILHARSNDCN